MGNVLLTGAAGFIGYRTAVALLARGNRVVGIDNMNDYYDVRLKEHRLAPLLEDPRFTFRKLDVEDAAGVDALFREFKLDAVVNLAARAGVRYSMENPRVYMTTNALGTLHVLEAMQHTGVKKLVLASTSSLYAGQPVPFTEDLPVNTPISPYAASKKAAEVMAYSFHHLYGIDVSVLRYFTVYGPAGRPDMAIFRFVRWIDEGSAIELYGDGSQSRDHTYVDDIAAGTVAALAPLGYEVVNLGGGGEPVPMLDVIRRIGALLGKEPVVRHLPFHKADLPETRASISKAAHLLGWKPLVDLDEGLARTVAWYQANRDIASKISL